MTLKSYYSKLKGKESKPKANVARVKSSQLDDSDSDSSTILLTITTPIICYSEISERILDMGATYHVSSKRNWFISFKNLDGGLVQMSDNFTCNMNGVCIVLIKMFDGMVRELKNVRYIPQMKNLISIGALEVHGLEFSGRDRVFRMLHGSMVVLKGVRHNLYYLKSKMVTGQLATSVRMKIQPGYDI